MIRTGRVTQDQKDAIEDIFYERRYKRTVDVMNDLIDVGLKHIDEFDDVEINSKLTRDGSYFKFRPDTSDSIEELKQRRKIKDTIVIIRKLIEIGLKHKDELPKSST